MVDTQGAPQERWTSPWRRAHPVRSTLALVFPLLGMALQTFLLLSYGIGTTTVAWSLAIVNALLFASVVASTRAGWLSRVAFGSLMIVSVWQLYRVLAR